jgi:pimeloyl-ACP methyl ester carboxylesterase
MDARPAPLTAYRTSPSVAATVRSTHRPILLGALLMAAVLAGCSGAGSPPRGNFDIGGRTLFIECHGSGTPVIVLESIDGYGTGPNSAALAAKLSGEATVCRYDRAGLGRSDPAPAAPRSLHDLVDDLAKLLQAAAVPGPYLLVGPGLAGGELALGYALLHTDRVAGLVILDTDLPTTDPARQPLAGLLTQAQRDDYYLGASGALAWQAEVAALVHPISVLVRVATATQPDILCPDSWGQVVCTQALARHLEFAADWRQVNPEAVLARDDVLPAFRLADEAAAQEILAALESVRRTSEPTGS